MLSNVIAELSLRQLPCGGWAALASSSQPAIEPTCYAIMALSSVPAGDIERAQDFLLRTQNPDGSWPAVLGDDQGGAYVTSLATIALRDLVSAIPARLRAIHWLLNCAGKESNWFWKWKFRTADRHVRFDPDKYGWPWFPGTTSWVVPTAFAILALSQVPCSCDGFESVPTRVDTGIQMLFDRACPGGGWNAGNGVVYESRMSPHIDDTAIALSGVARSRPAPGCTKRCGVLGVCCPCSCGSLESRLGKSRTRCTSPVRSAGCWFPAWTFGSLKYRRHGHAGDSESGSGPHPGPVGAWRSAMSITRRELIVGSAALAAGSAVTTPFLLPKFHFDHRLKRSRVAVLNAHEYSHDLDQILCNGSSPLPDQRPRQDCSPQSPTWSISFPAMRSTHTHYWSSLRRKHSDAWARNP